MASSARCVCVRSESKRKSSLSESRKSMRNRRKL